MKMKKKSEGTKKWRPLRVEPSERGATHGCHVSHCCIVLARISRDRVRSLNWL
jgi:hypothetical protein